MGFASEGVKPTVMELLLTKAKIKLAENGHRLLKQKRDVLVLEFFGILERAKDLRAELNKQMARAFNSLALAEAYHGAIDVESTALAVRKVPGASITVRNVMGVKIASIDAPEVRKNLQERGYGIIGSSAKIDEAAASFEEALSMCLELAETENALKRLIREIEKTKRRVNALEYILIPTLKEQAKYILMRLDEMERDRFFTLKMIKKKFEEEVPIAPAEKKPITGDFLPVDYEEIVGEA